MSGVLIAAGQSADVWVHEGPRLLADLDHGPGLAVHRRRSAGRGPWPTTATELAELLEAIDLRGRGGAAFPLARKVRTVAKARGRAVVVVNAAEGEPASSKDSALMMLKPHLVLDGAQLVAQALGADTIHVVVPGERAAVQRSVRTALAERADADRVPMTMHVAECRFVAGESSAVLELLAGRPNLPVTTTRPSAISGLGGRPTLLSNAETYAQTAVIVRDGVDAYCSLGTHAEPGTRLLTIDGDGERPTVLEVAHGTRLAPLLAAADADADNGLLLGGYHGTWLPPEAVPDLTVSATAMLDAGAAIGAGVMLPLRSGVCPVRRTAVVVGYLAGESANRCGPCKFGLPALAHALRDLALGAVQSSDRVIQLMDAVERRGACHHPDGTTRSIRSLLRAFPLEVAAHLSGTCTAAVSSAVLAGAW
jgi:NADH:ubiquinone oxidoreductase subunit F (NADH-binding)